MIIEWRYEAYSREEKAVIGLLNLLTKFDILGYVDIRESISSNADYLVMEFK